VFDKVEQCLRAKPVIPFSEVCNCRLCDPRSEEGLANVRWEQKAYQDSVEKQRDVFCCRQIEDHYELIGCLCSEPHQNMLLLDAMTSHLGELNSWPTYILQHLFIDHASPVRTKKFKRVMAFFYGNDVPSNWPIRSTTPAMGDSPDL